jgi:hypothetical protein
MPFVSDAQRKYMFARHPAIAKRWAKKYGVSKNLPEHVMSAIKKRTKKK